MEGKKGLDPGNGAWNAIKAAFFLKELLNSSMCESSGGILVLMKSIMIFFIFFLEFTYFSMNISNI